MSLRKEWEASGNWLFKYRSYVPLLVYLFLLPALYFYVNQIPEFCWSVWWSIACLAISITGLKWRALTIGYTPGGTSGRNTKEQVAETLNVSGVYGMHRHPLYFANYLMWLGLLLFVGLWWFVALASLFFWLYYERIMYAEEMYIIKKFGDIYEQWSAKTPPFLPKLRNWVEPNISFSWKSVLRREYSGFMAMMITFGLIELMRNYFLNHSFEISQFWIIILIGSLIVVIPIWCIRKFTSLFDEQGRS